MTSDTREKIIELLEKNQVMTPKDLINELGLTEAAVFRQLKKLQEQGLVNKQGSTPKVFYSLNSAVKPISEAEADPAQAKIFQDWLKVSSDGQLKTGLTAFLSWAATRKLEPETAIKTYVATRDKYARYHKDGLINGLPKMQKTFTDVYLDQLFYLDFYSWEIFGRTKLGELLLYAKQGQNKPLIKAVINEIREPIKDLIKKYNITAVGFVPPTVKRELQLMKELANQLNLPLRQLKITKIPTPIPVPQKTLNQLAARVENARMTFVVEENEPFENVLLIDDAVGSGATLNEIARKMKNKGLVTGKLIGLAITGSANGFDVIQEV